ncbi:hydroxymethylbilane synthase [Orrella daihaiensis]|uniref:Porphobilinogen deaminase n=1 Tax=Orrella daihaiensis TaxID=2782176 RepID=A0ABY4AHH3_9BURK|nr:hydroxymethylbilane synthase [Orrella daihaiensis]UOD49740.1 hydroxymethylbilane synthase [Orrella daihaiensis]
MALSIPDRLVIATRASRLALWQAEHVQALLQAQYPQTEVSLLKLSTRGDEILDRSLQKVGGKGLFIKELENALIDGRADLAVHSLKDVPVDMPPLFELAAILPRAESRDAWVSSKYANLQELPVGAIIGTSSLRRECQLRAQRPDIVVKPLRGNLDTRLKKLDDGEFDAIILAAVGLQRLELSDRIRTIIPLEQSLPAAGQGALGIEVLKSRPEMSRLMQPLACMRSTAIAQAERTVSRVLGGSCSTPLAAHAQLINDQLTVYALVATPDGQTILRANARGPISDADAPEELGAKVAQALLDQGADKLLAQLDH